MISLVILASSGKHGLHFNVVPPFFFFISYVCIFHYNTYLKQVISITVAPMLRFLHRRLKSYLEEAPGFQ